MFSVWVNKKSCEDMYMWFAWRQDENKIASEKLACDPGILRDFRSEWLFEVGRSDQAQISRGMFSRWLSGNTKIITFLLEAWKWIKSTPLSPYKMNTYSHNNHRVQNMNRKFEDKIRGVRGEKLLMQFIITFAWFLIFNF